MNKKTCSALAACLLLGLASCSDENPWADFGGGLGTISLTLTTDEAISDAVPQTRSEGSDYFKLPETDDFYVHLIKADGSTHTHGTVSEFREVPHFPTGSYTLKVYSGSLEEEGYYVMGADDNTVKPYFEGVEEITVLEDRETKAVVKARLGHTLVSVSYTDEFKNYMKEYKTQLHSDGHSWVDVPQEQPGPAFLVPGEVSLWINFTDNQGRELSLNPAKFMAEAASHYQIRLNVNDGNVGVATLQIQFIGELTEEVVNIDLTDELFTAPAPEVQTEGFAAGEEMEFMSGAPSPDQLRFNILSYGGLQPNGVSAVNLTVNRKSGSLDAPFIGELNLLESAAQKDMLEKAGIRCLGIFRNPDKLAYIDITGMPEVYPAGEYEVSVTVTDAVGRASEPVTATLICKDPTVSATPIKANASTHVGTLLVTYNGGIPTDLSFKAANRNGMLVNAPVLEWKVDDGTRARIEDITYYFKIQLPEFGDRVEEEVAIYRNGSLVETVYLPVSASFITDAFAWKIMVKTVARPEKVSQIVGDAVVTVYKDGAPVDGLAVSKNASSGIISLAGLEPSTRYTYKVEGYEDGESFEGEFTTESNLQLPNGDFSQTHNTINITSINTGGLYKVSLHSDCYNFTDIIRDEADGWASLNQYTCYEGSNPRNTWFMVPSTFVENGVATIRSVAFDHEGQEPPYSNRGWTDNWYNEKTPDKLSGRASGEMFLGTYSFNGTESRVNGIDFSTRPSSVSFDYTYVPLENEVGEVEVSVMGADGKVLTSTKADITASATSMKVNLPDYTQFGAAAEKLYISFKSTKGDDIHVTIPSGSALYDRSNNDNGNFGGTGSGSTPPASSGFHIKPNMYYALATGSVLTVSNVTLGYDVPAAVSNMAKKRTGNKRR